MTDDRGWHSRGYLPHFDGEDVLQSITIRLFDAIPKDLLKNWQLKFIHLPETEAAAAQREKLESYLDLGTGNCWLKDYQIAKMVEDALLHFDGQRYHLCAWVIMSNHVHALVLPKEGWAVSGIVHSWKSYTSNQANKMLGRAGKFWQEDYFDRYIRNERHYYKAIDYIEANPVKAGLCDDKTQWLFSSAWRR